MAKDLSILDALAEALLFELPDRAAQEQAIGFLSAFATLMASDPDVRALFIHARGKADPGMRCVQERLAHLTEPTVINALSVLMRLGLMDQTDAFLHRLKERREEMGAGREVQVTSAFPLREEERERIKRALERRWEMPVTLMEKIDGSLFGGYCLRSGDWRFDASIKGGIRSLEKAMSL